MTSSFILGQFTNHGGFVSYAGEFVARFKHKPRSAPSFIKFLVRNFTPAEYFARLKAGEAPLTIARSKGYELPHIKRWRVEGLIP